MLSDAVRQRAKFLLMRRVKQAEEEVISSWCNVQDKTLFPVLESMSMDYFCFVKQGKAQTSTLQTTLTQLSDLRSCSMLGHGQFTVVVRKGQLLQIIKLPPTS